MSISRKGLMGLAGLVLIAACDGPSEEEALGDYFERQAAVVETAARALQADDCDLAINTLNARSTPRLYPVASAVLRIDGRCLDRDPAMAARLLTEEASKHAEQDLDPDTLTEEDRELLEEPARFRELKAALERHRTDDDFGPLWGLSSREMILGFVDPVTGPWPLPEALQAEIDDFLETVAQGGPAVLDVAAALKEGSDSFPQDDFLSAQWARAASEVFGHAAAKKALLRWMSEPGFCDDPATGTVDRRPETWTSLTWLTAVTWMQ